MASPDDSRIRRFLNHAPVWQTIPVLAILVCVGSLIAKAFIYRLRSGGWDMDWAIKFVDSLGFGVIFSLLWTWLTRRDAKNEQEEHQGS
jgi:hypothetical protein